MATHKEAEDRYQVVVPPWRNTIEEIRKLESSYAQLALQNMYVLNAAGLAAIPVIAKFMSENSLGKLPAGTYLLAAAFFAVGLLATIASNVCGYKSLSSYREGLQKAVQSMDGQLAKNEMATYKSEAGAEEFKTGGKRTTWSLALAVVAISVALTTFGLAAFRRRDIS